MLKKLYIMCWVFIMALALNSPESRAADTTSNQTGSFNVSVNANAVTLAASNGVYMSVSVNATAANSTTAANVATNHGKGNIAYGLDSDGGGLYAYSKAPGTTTVTVPAAAVSSDDFSGVGSWANTN